jgi:hypothetical protein
MNVKKVSSMVVVLTALCFPRADNARAQAATLPANPTPKLLNCLITATVWPKRLQRTGVGFSRRKLRSGDERRCPPAALFFYVFREHRNVPRDPGRQPAIAASGLDATPILA